MATGPLRVLTHLPVEALSRFKDRLRGVELIAVPRQGELRAGVEGEVLLTMAWGSENLAATVERGVRWIHTIGTGVDHFPLHAVGNRVLTCARGASSIPIAEWVLAVMLAFEKQLPDAWLDVPPAQWNLRPLGGLHGRTLGLVGLGGIGEAIATRALAFGMRVRAQRRTRRKSPIAGVEIASDLEDLLACADHLVLAAAATPATHHLIDRRSLKCVKSGVHLVNIARGSLVDQEALREALDDDRVAGASLDTVDPEPLPEGHWLYTHPKVRLSAHISWNMPGALDWIFETFVANLERYRAGEELVGVVDPSEGY